MKPSEFFLLIMAVAIGAFLALIVWTLIVKSQISATVAGNSTVNTLLSLFGSKAAAPLS
jgi:uncharacterized membrane protein